MYCKIWADNIRPINKNIILPPVAQLDNATDSDSGERGFKSLRAGHIKSREFLLGFLCGSLSIRRDLKVSVKKTVRWTVFSELRL